MLDASDEQDFQDLVADVKQKKFRVRHSQPARTVINRLFAQKGYAQVQQRDQLQTLWNETVGPHRAEHSRCGRLQRGTLEVIVGNSLVLSELTFDKRNILVRLQQDSAGQAIRDLKFKLGAVD